MKITILVVMLTLSMLATSQTYESINRTTETVEGSVFGPSIDSTKFIFSDSTLIIVNSSGNGANVYNILHHNKSTMFYLIRKDGTMENFSITVQTDEDSNLFTILYSPSVDKDWVSTYTALKKDE